MGGEKLGEPGSRARLRILREVAGHATSMEARPGFADEVLRLATTIMSAAASDLRAVSVNDPAES